MATAGSRRNVPPAAEPPPPPPPLALAVIRIALLLGVLLFGAMSLFIQRRGTWAPAPADSLETLRVVGIGVWIAAALAVIVLRLRAPAASSLGGRSSPSIIGWAIGEAVAMFGGVHYFLSGTPTWYINGLLFLVATFIVFPIARVRR